MLNPLKICSGAFDSGQNDSGAGLGNLDCHRNRSHCLGSDIEYNVSTLPVGEVAHSSDHFFICKNGLVGAEFARQRKSMCTLTASDDENLGCTSLACGNHRGQSALAGAKD